MDTLAHKGLITRNRWIVRTLPGKHGVSRLALITMRVVRGRIGSHTGVYKQ